MALAGGTAVVAMALFAVVALAAIGYAISTVYMLGRLQSHHEHIYTDLGKPGVYISQWYDWTKVIPFIWRRDYLSIPDAVVARSGMWARATLVVWAGSLILFLTVFAAFGE